MFGSSENQRLVPSTLALRTVIEKMHEQVTLRFFRYAEYRLIDTLCGGITRSDFDLNRISQNARCQLTNIIGVGGGEHQILPLFRQ